MSLLKLEIFSFKLQVNFMPKILKDRDVEKITSCVSRVVEIINKRLMLNFFIVNLNIVFDT